MTDDECRRIELEAYAHLIRCSRDDFACMLYLWACNCKCINPYIKKVRRETEMNAKQFDIVGDSVKLTEEQQKLLINFLVNILKDTKHIQVKCDCSHEDLYHEVVEKMEELSIVNIREDWDIDNSSDWKVRLTFRYPLRNLLDFKVM